MSLHAAKCSGGLSFFEDPRLEPGDFGRRWAAARLSSLRALLSGVDGYSDSCTESELLALVSPDKKDLALRGVFDAGRKLGRSLGKFLGLSAELVDFKALFAEGPVPCFRGDWSANGGAHVLNRTGCAVPEALGSFGCDYWREAVDGLVIGASDEARLVRHRSVGHGDPDCVDVFFNDAGTGPKLGLHRGVVPAELQTGLAVVARQFGETGVTVFWDGYSEGTLFYRMEAGAKPLCGAGGQLMHRSLLAEIQKFFPGLKAKDGSPIAVYGGADSP